MKNRKIIEAILETLKSKIEKPDKWDTFHKFNDIKFYFSSKDGDVTGFSNIKYLGIEVTVYDGVLGKVENIDIFKTFNIHGWLEAIKEKIEDKEVSHKKEDFIGEFDVVTTTKEIFVEDVEAKVKAEMLDKLLENKNLTN